MTVCSIGRHNAFIDNVSSLIHIEAAIWPTSLPGRNRRAELKPIAVAFWRTEKGNEPVREWLREMPKAGRSKIGDDLAILQYGWPVGMPLCRSMKNGLWELRSELNSKRLARILFTFFEEQLVLLHSFIKKTRKTPKDDSDLAIKRKKTLG